MNKIEQLKEARVAYHQLMTGTAVVSIEDSVSGTRVQYTRANLSTLKAYIDDLAVTVEGATVNRRRPARVAF